MLSKVSEDKLLEIFAHVYVQRPLAVFGRTEYEQINQELERRTQATERQHGIYMVPESDDYRNPAIVRAGAGAEIHFILKT